MPDKISEIAWPNWIRVCPCLSRSVVRVNYALLLFDILLQCILHQLKKLQKQIRYDCQDRPTVIYSYLLQQLSNCRISLLLSCDSRRRIGPLGSRPVHRNRLTACSWLWGKAVHFLLNNLPFRDIIIRITSVIWHLIFPQKCHHERIKCKSLTCPQLLHVYAIGFAKQRTNKIIIFRIVIQLNYIADKVDGDNQATQRICLGIFFNKLI